MGLSLLLGCDARSVTGCGGVEVRVTTWLEGFLWIYRLSDLSSPLLSGSSMNKHKDNDNVLIYIHEIGSMY